MGCNMCVVKHPEEQYRIMFQQKGGLLRPVGGHGKGRGRRPSQLPLDRPQNSQEALQPAARRGHRRRGTFGCGAIGSSSTSFYSVAMAPVPDCVDSGTQTDITFQNLAAVGKSRARHPHLHHRGRSPSPPPPSPPPPHLMAADGMEEFFDYDDYVDASHQELERQDELEYEEVELYKSSQQEKLGLTVCYRTDDEDHLGIYVGEVNPNSIAAKNGRIREGDRIIQINGVDIQNREEAVAILTRDDSVNFSLLLARPDVETENVGEKDVEMSLNGGGEAAGYHRLCQGARQRDSAHMEEEEEEEEEEGGRGEQEDRPVPLPPLLTLAPLLCNSQELDSGVGRTDDSTRYEESSEHDLLGDQTSGPSTNSTNTPGSARKFRLGPSPRPSPRPSPGPGPSPGRGDSTHPFFSQRELQPSCNSLPGMDWAAGGGAYSPHHHQHHQQQQQQQHKHHPHPHQPPLMMMPGLTEEEFQRYEELLDLKCQYERHKQQSEAATISLGGQEDEEAGGPGVAGEDQEALLSPSVPEANRNAAVSEHEMALIDEELRHLEFKCRNILRAQKMQQLRERCLKAWMMEESVAAQAGLDNEEEDDPHHHELSAINELPERSDDKDSSSAYNTGGESCRSTPLVSTDHIPPEEERGLSPPLLLPLGSLPSIRVPLTPQSPRQDRDRERRHSNLSCNFSPSTHRKHQAASGNWTHGSSSTPSTPSKFRSLSREVASSSRRGVADGCRPGAAINRPGGASAESSPYFSRRRQNQHQVPERYQSCMTLPSDGLVEPLERVQDRARVEVGDRAVHTGSSGPASPRSINSAPCGLEDHQDSLSRLGLALPLGMAHSSPTAAPQRMEWKVKIRSDGTRYVSKRPVRDRLLKARAMKIKEERSGMTTDDDAASEMKQGRYWSKEERKQQLLRAREHRRRRELMIQSRLDYLRGARDSSSPPGGSDNPQLHPSSSILSLSQRKTMKKRNRRILDNWITIQELLAHGSRSPDGKKIYSPLLSVTTV